MRDKVKMSGLARRRAGYILRLLSLSMVTVVLLSMMLGTAPALAEEGGGSGRAVQTTIADLVGVDATHDGDEVVFTGEAIGGSYRGDDEGHRWVNLTDGGGNTIGVFMTDDDASKVSDYGRYGHRGSTMTITGVYHTACEEGHEGELDVHATGVVETSPGGPQETDTVATWQWVGALCVLAFGLILLLVDRAMKHWRP